MSATQTIFTMDWPVVREKGMLAQIRQKDCALANHTSGIMIWGNHPVGKWTPDKTDQARQLGKWRVF